jgi:dTDP-4-amino-4,6-dideoxygalactose transaminase
VEDAAQAHGATIDGRPAGSFDVGCFSLYATKNLTTGEGGMITTDDDTLAARLRILRNQGMRERYEYVEPGHNYRLTDPGGGRPPAASVGSQTTERRRDTPASCPSTSPTCPASWFPPPRPAVAHVFHQYTIR